MESSSKGKKLCSSRTHLLPTSTIVFISGFARSHKHSDISGWTLLHEHFPIGAAPPAQTDADARGLLQLQLHLRRETTDVSVPSALPKPRRNRLRLTCSRRLSCTLGSFGSSVESWILTFTLVNCRSFMAETQKSRLRSCLRSGLFGCVCTHRRNTGTASRCCTPCLPNDQTPPSAEPHSYQ